MIAPSPRPVLHPDGVVWVLPVWFLVLRWVAAAAVWAALVVSADDPGALGWGIVLLATLGATYREQWRWSRRQARLWHLRGIGPLVRVREYLWESGSRLVLIRGQRSFLAADLPTGRLTLEAALGKSGAEALRILGERTAGALGLGFVVEEARH